MSSRSEPHRGIAQRVEHGLEHHVSRQLDDLVFEIRLRPELSIDTQGALGRAMDRCLLEDLQGGRFDLLQLLIMSDAQAVSEHKGLHFGSFTVQRHGSFPGEDDRQIPVLNPSTAFAGEPGSAFMDESDRHRTLASPWKLGVHAVDTLYLTESAVCSAHDRSQLSGRSSEFQLTLPSAQTTVVTYGILPIE